MASKMIRDLDRVFEVPSVFLEFGSQLTYPGCGTCLKAWREEVVHARTGELHVWVGGTSQQLLLVVRERTGWRVARGAGITALAGAGAGGFGLVLGPLIGASAFVLGASIAGAQVWETLRRRWRTVWSPARRIAV